MLNLNTILKNAQVYSIEYTGYFILKFTLSNDTEIAKQFDDIAIEFMSGINSNNVSTELLGYLFSLYGATVSNVSLSIDNDIRIEFSNGCKVYSLKDANDIVDRDWILEVAQDKNHYILSDKGNLFYSDSMKILLD